MDKEDANHSDSSVTATPSVTPIEPPSPQPKVKPAASSWAALLKKNETVKKPTAAPSTNGVATNGKAHPAKSSKPLTPTPTAVPKFTGVAGKQHYPFQVTCVCILIIRFYRYYQ